MPAQILRICPICNTMYPSGGYTAHSTSHPVKQPAIRHCTLCGESYKAGSYAAHRAAAGHPAHRAGPEPPSQRNLDIVALLDANPRLTLEEVAVQYGITRERVRQIYRRTTGKTSAKRWQRPTTRACKACGELYPIGESAAHTAETGHSPGELNYKRNAEWARLYTEDGLSSVQIGRIYKQAASYVLTVLRRHGVVTRPLKGGIVVRRRYG